MRLMAVVFLALTGVVILFQPALVAGAPWGALTQGGAEPGVLSAQGRGFAGLSALVLALMAVIVAGRAGMVRSPLPRGAIWVVIGYLALGVVLHLMTPSAAERRLWLPVIGVQLACAIGVARGVADRGDG